MDESRRFGRSGPPAVEAPCFHGTRCPPVLHAGRSAGRGYAAGHPRPPYDPSATAAQIALRALPPRLGRARTRSRFDETGRDGELRPCRAGRGAWRARVLTSTEVDVCGVLRTVPLGPVYRFRSLLFSAAVCEAPPPAPDRVPSFSFAPPSLRRRFASAL